MEPLTEDLEKCRRADLSCPFLLRDGHSPKAVKHEPQMVSRFEEFCEGLCVGFNTECAT